MNAEILARGLSIPIARAQKWAPHLAGAFDEFDIITIDEQCEACAQIGVESDALVYVREIWGPNAWQRGYGDREDLGNTDPRAIAFAAAAGKPVGRFYSGVGLIQTTGFFNTLKVSMALYGDDRAARDPSLLELPRDAGRSAGFFWKSHRLNDLVGNTDAITRIVNGRGMLKAKERRDFAASMRKAFA